MADVDQIVDPTIGADFGVGAGAPVDGGVGADFAVVADHHSADLGNLYMTAGVRGEAESVLTDPGSGINIDPRPDQTMAERRARPNPAVAAQNHAGADNRVRPDYAAGPEIRRRTDYRPVGNGTASTQHSRGAHVRGARDSRRWLRFRVQSLAGKCKGFVGRFTDQQHHALRRQATVLWMNHRRPGPAAGKRLAKFWVVEKAKVVGAGRFQRCRAADHPGAIAVNLCPRSIG